MSGVKFVSMLFAIFATFLWGGFVVDSWQKNQAQRNASLKTQEKVVAPITSATLDHADKLAVAASEEFNKITNTPDQQVVAKDKGKAVDKVTPVAAKQPAQETPPVTEKQIAHTQIEDEPKSQKIAALDKKKPDQSLTRGLAKKSETKESQDTPQKTNGKKPLWVVPTGVAPEYNDEKAVKVGTKPWKIPTGNDPIQSRVGAKLTKMAETVKDNAADAADKVGGKLSSLANDVKDTIVAEEKWTVPTGADPEYPGKDVLAKSDTKWRVPDGVTPYYGEYKKIQLADKGDRLVKGFFKSENLRAPDESGSQKATSPEGIITGKLEARLSDEEPLTEIGERDLGVIKKDTSRLSKDLVAVPVEKYASNEPLKKDNERLGKIADEKVAEADEAKQPVSQEKAELKVATLEQKESNSKEAAEPKEIVTATPLKQAAVETEAKAKPIWTVPTGKTPDAGVVGTLERGLSKVKQVASDAGKELADTVSAIGANVKEAVASSKKWEVPTGATPEYEIAELPTKKQPAKVAEVKKVDEVTKTVKEEAVKDAPKEQKKEVKQSKDVAETKDETKDKIESKVKVAKSEDKSSDTGKVVNVPLPKMKEIVVAALPKDPVKPIKPTKVEQEEPELFVSAKLKPVGEVQAEALEVVVPAKRQDVAVKEPETKKEGVLNRIIGYIKDVKDGTVRKPTEEKRVSGLDKARFAAIKHLMVDEVKYKFTNAKKGEGKLSISGRSQKGSKLSLYVGPRYLGEVEPDLSGDWAFEKEIFLPQGQHIVHAQQMSKSGLVLARKTIPYTQKIAGRPPKDYDSGVGLALGDKALKVMQAKLKKDKPGQKAQNPFAKTASKSEKVTESDPDVDAKVAQLPLPKRKIKDKKLKEVKVAALTKKVSVLPEKKKESDELKSKQQKSSQEAKTKEVDAKGPTVTTKIYVVKSGDTLGAIAKKVYGNSLRYKDILKLNPKLKNANRIYPKQKLVVAGSAKVTLSKKVDDEKTKKSSIKKVASLKKQPASKKDTDDKKPDFYKVKAGESLWIIAKKVLGNGNKYKELIKLNPQLAKNPKLIRPNMKLKVKKG